MGSIDRSNNTPQLLNRLRMRQVALMLAIDQQRTLRGAAAQLGMTQPAATKMLHELESALGLALFERVGRGLQLNAAGERVTGYFRHMSGSMEAMNRELHALCQGSEGRLAVGSIMAASPGRLTQTLLALKRQWPLLSIEVAVDTSDRLLTQLAEGVLEVVIGRSPAQGDATHLFRAIDDEVLSIVVGLAHPLAGANHVPLAALQPYGWVLQPPGSPLRALVEQEFEAQGLTMPRGLIETGSILTTMNLVRNSELVAVIPHAVAQDSAAHGMVHILPCKLGRNLQAYGSLVRRDRPLGESAQQFLALLHREQ